MSFFLKDDSYKQSDKLDLFQNTDTATSYMRLKKIALDNVGVWQEWQEFQYLCDTRDGDIFFRSNIDRDVVIKANMDFSVVSLSEKANETALLNLLFHPFRYHLIERGNVCAHGAVVVHNGSGILFCGLSGVGKSTQADLWCRYTDSWVLNYDKPAILFENDGVYVAGTPWSGKENRFINFKVPLKGIVFVNQDKKNHIIHVSQAEAFALIRPNFMVYPITPEMMDKYDIIILKLISSVQVYNLYATISEEAVQVVYDELFMDESYEQVKGRRKKMKIRDGFMLRNIADEWIVIPRGAHAINFNGTVLLNNTGAFAFKQLQDDVTRDQIAAAMASEFEIDLEIAARDTDAFLEMLRSENMLEEN